MLDAAIKDAESLVAQATTLYDLRRAQRILAALKSLR